MGLNRFGSAVRGVFATGVTMAWCQSSEIWEVWRERLQMRESVGAMHGLRVLRASSLIGVEGFEGCLGF